MDALYARCCGLDIHKKLVVACRIVPGPTGQPRKEIRSFGTTTAAIEDLRAWLSAEGVTHVAMEATGVYWKPLFNLLEDAFHLVLANAQHIKQVPGRKTDVKDCEWIADLLRHGLLRPSYVPDRPRRELQELTRYRTSLIRERAAAANRLQKLLEGANIKLGDVATDVLGASGRAILEALAAGETDSTVLAQHARGRMRPKRAALELALQGSVGPHQRFLLRQQLAHVDHLTHLIATLSAEIAQRLAQMAARPSAPAATDALERLDSIPGVGRRTAEVLIAEVGLDMRPFPSSAQLASWAGLCPGNHQSAGKQKSGRTRKGNAWLYTALVEAAQATTRTSTYLGAQYHRLAARRGSQRATVAVAHSILVIAYHLLREGGTYQDLGAAYFDTRDRAHTRPRLVTRLEQLGYTVHLEERVAA
jgi:transposase